MPFQDNGEFAGDLRDFCSCSREAGKTPQKKPQGLMAPARTKDGERMCPEIQRVSPASGLQQGGAGWQREINVRQAFVLR